MVIDYSARKHDWESYMCQESYQENADWILPATCEMAVFGRKEL
jgi:hypothetical protein